MSINNKIIQQEPLLFDEGDESESLFVDPVAQTAKNVFGVPSLYPWQRLVIANILESTEMVEIPSRESLSEEETDILNKGLQVVLLPTGAGKSLCFMVPGVILNRPTLIIYPLLALMSDQLRRIEEKGLAVAIFRGQQSLEEREGNFKKLDSGAKFILANPEVLQSEKLLQRLKQYKIIHAAIDEAHCVSEWGDSFRPSYLELGNIIRALEIPVVTAFTATASPPVLNRITEILFNGQNPYLMQSTSDRQNIHYSVQYAGAKEKAALKLALTMERPLLVFCGTRKKSEQTARLFREFIPKDEVRFYHAGLTKEEKAATEKWFFPHQKGILCCTCAFGMGVDKSDIRTVIHLEPSPTAEAYIQEAGRGGRDGKPVKAILLWNQEDSVKAQAFPVESRQRVLANFAEAKTCRRQVLLDALKAEQATCSGCDICDSKEKGLKIIRYGKDEKMVSDYLCRYSGRWTMEQAAQEIFRKIKLASKDSMYEKQDFLHIIKQNISKENFKLKGRKVKRVYFSGFTRKKSILRRFARLHLFLFLLQAFLLQFFSFSLS